MKNIKVILIGLSFVLSGSFVNAQTNNTEGVSIAPTVTPPDPSAMLDVTATDKGVLIPRIALTMTTSAAPVTAPANSLLVYNTATINDVTPGFYYWDNASSKWMKFRGKNEDWKVIGTVGTMDNGESIPEYAPAGVTGTISSEFSIRKRGDNVVEATGCISHDGTNLVGDLLFYLPEGYYNIGQGTKVNGTVFFMPNTGEDLISFARFSVELTNNEFRLNWTSIPGNICFSIEFQVD